MTTTESKHTKSSVLAMARRKWNNAIIEYDPSAPTPEKRQQIREQRERIDARVNAIDAELKVMPNTYRPLIDAAEWVVQIGGDEASVAALTKALAARKHHDDLVDERRALKEERDSISDHRNRWRVSHSNGMFNTIEASGDTLEELAERLARRVER